MFDTTHILYMLISSALTVVLLALCYRYVRGDAAKGTVLKISAVSTVVIHYSSLWVDFFSNGGNVAVQSTMLLPLYPCNVCMWLLLIYSFMKNKEGRVARIIGEFLFLAGTVCAVIGIVFNENYGANPNLLDYGILKGLLSHSTMLFGLIYLYVSGFVRLGIHNVLSVTSGMLLLLVDGLVMNGLYDLFGIETANSMYLVSAPFESLPWINTATIGVAAVVLSFLIAVIYEQIAVCREERWYVRFKKFINRKKDKGEE